MMNRKTNSIALGLCAMACAAMSLTLSGCGGEEEQAVVQAPPAPPPPPPAPPAVTPVEQLMIDLNIDRRIVMAEDRAPDNNTDRKAVLVFFDAFARGNSQSLKGMLPLPEQMELNALVQSGEWQETVANIQKIEIQTGTNTLSQKCALAVIEVGSMADLTFQPQLWYYNTESEEPVFEAAPSPPGILDKLSGDWIASWHQILAAELAMADKPDEDFEIAQRNLETGGSGDASGSAPSGGGAPGGSPAAPAGQPLRDPSTRPPVRAPG